MVPKKHCIYQNKNALEDHVNCEDESVEWQPKYVSSTENEEKTYVYFI